MVFIEHDDGSTISTVPVSSDEVVVRRGDLLQCLQVAYWRAGLIDPQAGIRLKEALGIGEAELVPKPGPH